MPSSACAERCASWTRQGATITFAAVAERARVSRAFLDQHAQLRSQIEELRKTQAAAPAGVPVRQRASDASLRAWLRAALDESQRQREEIARLRDELALAHGRVRELELDRRVAPHVISHGAFPGACAAQPIGAGGGPGTDHLRQ